MKNRVLLWSGSFLLKQLLGTGRNIRCFVQRFEFAIFFSILGETICCFLAPTVLIQNPH